MLGDNIKQIRKKRGYSQETLAQELNVVRQTISKWEKGLSVPDADMLSQIAEVLDVPVTELLNIKSEMTDMPEGDSHEVSKQLSILNDQFAKELGRKRRNRKILLFLIPIVLLLIASVIAVVSHTQIKMKTMQTESIVVPVHSDIYTQTEIDDAISVVLNNFKRWETKCKIISIQYVGDEKIDTVTLDYCKSMAAGKQFDKYIVLSSSFQTPKDSDQGLEPDKIYSGWMWYLARESAGDWFVLGNGVA